MAAADQAEVCLFVVDRASEECLAAAARDFARHVLLPNHLAVVGIQRPDQSLFLWRNQDVAPVRRRCHCGWRRKIPVGAEAVGTVLRWIRNPTATCASTTCTASARRAAGTSGTCATANESTAGNILRTSVVPRVERQRLHRPQHLAVVHVERHYGVRRTR